MTSGEAWKIFMKTGNIIDYLVYIKIKAYNLINYNN